MYERMIKPNKIMTAMDTDYVAPDVTQFEKKVAATLEDFFG